jgi:histidyl-tRNA synthetase
LNRQIAGVRGVNALLPHDAATWAAVEELARSVLAAYGYAEIRLPVLERTELYARAVGEVTDIVEKEMYTFLDRNGESLSLRPEGTAGCVRAGIEAGLFHNQTQRLWYQGPMFRHERPQKGRYRQFHQLGVEAYGMRGPEIEAELILLGDRLMRTLGVKARLLLNSLGTAACRARYREALVQYLEGHAAALDEDSTRRLKRNPLRVLDSKNPDMAEVLAAAPKIGDYLDADAKAHFERLTDQLSVLGVNFAVAPRLVRGLDYYTHTVFEWVSGDLGAQTAICAGGRYDGLVAELGGAPTAAAGFAIGLERFMTLVTKVPASDAPDVFVMTPAALNGSALVLAESLRNAGLRVEVHLAGASQKSQMKRAQESRARCIVQAQDEEAVVVVCAGRNEGTVPWTDAVTRVTKALEAKTKHDDK